MAQHRRSIVAQVWHEHQQIQKHERRWHKQNECDCETAWPETREKTQGAMAASVTTKSAEGAIQKKSRLRRSNGCDCLSMDSVRTSPKPLRTAARIDAAIAVDSVENRRISGLENLSDTPLLSASCESRLKGRIGNPRGVGHQREREVLGGQKGKRRAIDEEQVLKSWLWPFFEVVQGPGVWDIGSSPA